MTLRGALKTVFVVSLAGLGFSGVLTYQEIWGAGGLSCPSPGAPGTILGFPACVYGFLMYLLIAAVSFAGLRAETRIDAEKHRATRIDHLSA
jgi:hypothetical protein